MLVKVTQEHIDKAKTNIAKVLWNELPHSCNCPVAAALKDTFKVVYARATYEQLFVGKFPLNSITFNVLTPEEVSAWMNMFDTSIDKQKPDVKPFEFELSLEGVKL